MSNIKQDDYQRTVEPFWSSLRMIREQIEDTFGPAANLESEEATLLRKSGPGPISEAEAICKALRNVGIFIAETACEVDSETARVAYALNDKT